MAVGENRPINRGGRGGLRIAAAWRADITEPHLPFSAAAAADGGRGQALEGAGARCRRAHHQAGRTPHIPRASARHSRHAVARFPRSGLPASDDVSRPGDHVGAPVVKHRPLPAAVLGAGCTVIASWLLGLHWNASASMPTGLYRTAALTARPVRGVTVLFCLAGGAAAGGLPRGYLEAGTGPGGSPPLLKPIAAVPWDYVVIDQNGVVVNGQPIPNSAPLAVDPSGRVLRVAVPPGSYVVRQDSVWVVSGHDPRSYDSRYWGPLPVNAIIGRA